MFQATDGSTVMSAYQLDDCQKTFIVGIFCSTLQKKAASDSFNTRHKTPPSEGS